jgi:flagellar protein FlaG
MKIPSVPVQAISTTQPVDARASNGKGGKPLPSGGEGLPSTRAQTAEAVQAAAAKIEEFLRENGRELSIRVDDSTGTFVVTVRDVATGDVIRQIPSEEALRVSRALETQAAVLVSLDA